MTRAPNDIAVGAIERSLGDVVEEGMTPDRVYDEAFGIALDALLDAGVSIRIAGPIAEEVAMRLAHP
jgi:hypothetical protein